MSEQVLDEETWPQEAEAAINDIRKHVKFAAISPRLRSSNQCVFINITTLEESHYCVEMSALGFRIVGNQYNDNTLTSDIYETPYAMLDTISVKFRESFGKELINKLADLANTRSEVA
ncbi:GSK3B-interacting protein isoform X2 [Manduca sexta]|nr:GSK3B-interacting protein isoform X2 [Manduca sexta]XP_037293700.1 GSK3B-interacting protein isoform X2 [Manduca sexta]